jgi:hypothetical protein
MKAMIERRAVAMILFMRLTTATVFADVIADESIINTATGEIVSHVIMVNDEGD